MTQLFTRRVNIIPAISMETTTMVMLLAVKSATTEAPLIKFAIAKTNNVAIN